MSYINPQAEEKFFIRQKEFIRRLEIGRDPLIFDVGANIGQSIEGYRRLFPECKITSFEPLPDCFGTLVRQFGGTDGISLENLALAETEGVRTFYSTRCKSASSLLEPDPIIRKKSVKGNYDYDKIEVKTGTLDSYCKRNGVTEIDILKIDVQGAELSVLKGADSLLKNGAIRLIYSEVLFAENYSGQSSLLSISAFLERHSYLLWDLSPFLFTRAGRLWTANAIFVSESTCKTLENYPEEFKEP